MVDPVIPEVDEVFQKSARAIMGLPIRRRDSVDFERNALQDGMLMHYLSQVKLSDTNVEARLEKEPFDLKDHLRDRNQR